MHSNSCTPFSCLLSLNKLVLLFLCWYAFKFVSRSWELVPPAMNLLSPNELRQWGPLAGHSYVGD
jgi:hypothetical protein